MKRQARVQANPLHAGQLVPVVAAAAAGDQRAWESLVVEFTPMLRRVVRRFRLTAEDVDDVVQSAWVSAFAHIGRVREAESIGGWLCVIARREAIRTLNRRRREFPVDEQFFSHERDPSGPESALLQAERCFTVKAAIDRLPTRQGRLLGVLFRDPDRSYSDISRTLEMPVGSIGPTRERALARLRQDQLLLTAIS
jgi:RNA polymerase sigma factor (sigma-70 family)